MVYIRAKTVKGDQYLYLVQSVWDSKKSTSRQEILKYLGKAKDVSIDDIPVDYRNNPKVMSFVSAHAGDNIKKNQQLIKKVQKDIFNSLTKGDFDKTLEIFQIYVKTVSLEKFYDNILRPVMYKIGELWASNKISIATEHVASNIAHELISNIIQKTPKLDNKAKVLVCTPSGEEHSLGCRFIESFLKSKGYHVFNSAPSAPAESIIAFIHDHKPNIVLVSITTEDNIKTGQRLVSKIKKEFNIPILVGGQAVSSNGHKFDATIVHENSLEKLPKLIRLAVKK